MTDEFKELLDKCEQEGSFERLVARARKLWRKKPAFSNEVADEMRNRSFVAYDSQGRAYDCFVPLDNSTSPGKNYQE